jgi:SAM-dependent methyltransferase
MNEAVRPEEISSYARMSGEVYDLIYANKDYAGEAAKLKAIIDARLKSGGNDLLEAACGTGSYIGPLSEHFVVDGFDLAAEQVAEAQKRFPDKHIFQADMTDFETDKTYDVVACLFSSIGYLTTKEELDKAIANMARATKPGGLVLVEPWLHSRMFKSGHVSVESNSNEKMAVSRVGVSSQEGNVSVLSMHHMVGTADGVEHFMETHRLAMHSDEDFADAFAKAGLQLEIDPEGLTGRRLCIGSKPISYLYS